MERPADASEIIRQVRDIEINTKRLVDGLISGRYHSVFMGQGVEFSEIREYRPGDDIRSIDWKVTARFDRPYIKEYIEERDLRVYFLLDVSTSGSFGNKTSKRWKATELIATLMFSAMRNNDAVGLMLFSDGKELFVPARKGKRHVLKLLGTMLSYKPSSNNTDLARALNFFSRVVKRRSVVFIISDFMTSEFSKELKMLRSKHDIIGVNIFDDREMDIPDIGLVELEDEETGEQILLDSSDSAFRTAYLELMLSQRRKLRSIFMKSGADLIELSTDEDYEVPLKRFFRHRIRRMVR